MDTLDWIETVHGQWVSVETTPCGAIVGRYKRRRPVGELKIKYTKLVEVNLYLAEYEKLPRIYGIGQDGCSASADLLSREHFIRSDLEVVFHQLRNYIIARADDGRSGVGLSMKAAMVDLVCTGESRDVVFKVIDDKWICGIDGVEAEGKTAMEAFAFADKICMEQVAGIPKNIKLDRSIGYGVVSWKAMKPGAERVGVGCGPTAKDAYKNWRQLWVSHLHQSITSFLQYQQDGSTALTDLLADWEHHLKEIADGTDA